MFLMCKNTCSLFNSSFITIVPDLHLALVSTGKSTVCSPLIGKVMFINLAEV